LPEVNALMVDKIFIFFKMNILEYNKWPEANTFESP